MSMRDTGMTLYLFFAHFNNAFELRVEDFTMAKNKSSALMIISFNTSTKYLQRKKKSEFNRGQVNLTFLNYDILT